MVMLLSAARADTAGNRRASPAIGVRLALAAVFAGSTAFFATSALAAAEKTATAGNLEEVVVTAEKRESTVQETPISISALSGEDLTS